MLEEALRQWNTLHKSKPCDVKTEHLWHLSGCELHLWLCSNTCSDTIYPGSEQNHNWESCWVYLSFACVSVVDRGSEIHGFLSWYVYDGVLIVFGSIAPMFYSKLSPI